MSAEVAWPMSTTSYPRTSRCCRARNAAEVGGAPPVGPVTGAALRFIAAAIGARSVVEIGTGCGTSGIWLLRGMRSGGGPDQRRCRAGASAAGPHGVPEAGFPATATG